jgi:hypothetical protein
LQTASDNSMAQALAMLNTAEEEGEEEEADEPEGE